MISRRGLAVAGLVASLAISGCSVPGLESLPAPNPLSGPTYHITAQFTDIENLTLGAKVKVAGVVVGDVTKIETHNYVAEVGMTIEKKFPLSTSATFQVRFTTPLGEDFVSVASDLKAGAKALPDGATVYLAQTSDAPSIEDTFAALSTLLNGGGLDQIHVIASELQQALHGRTSQARDMLIQLDAIIDNLDAHKNDIDNTLVGLQKMTDQLNKGTPVIEQALVEFPQTLQLLSQDTGRVRDLLQKVATLGDSVKSLLARSQSSMLTTLDNLRPVLDSLRSSESTLVPTFNSLIRFGQLFDKAAPGDYATAAATAYILWDSDPSVPQKGGTVTNAATHSRADAVASLLTGGQR